MLILWALAIIAVLAFSGARINMSLLTMLFESARPPATFQLPPSDAARNV